jgi:hypothetical protein
MRLIAGNHLPLEGGGRREAAGGVTAVPHILRRSESLRHHEDATLVGTGLLLGAHWLSMQIAKFLESLLDKAA